MDSDKPLPMTYKPLANGKIASESLQSLINKTIGNDHQLLDHDLLTCSHIRKKLREFGFWHCVYGNRTNLFNELSGGDESAYFKTEKYDFFVFQDDQNVAQLELDQVNQEWEKNEASISDENADIQKYKNKKEELEQQISKAQAELAEVNEKLDGLDGYEGRYEGKKKEIKMVMAELKKHQSNQRKLALVG